LKGNFSNQKKSNKIVAHYSLRTDITLIDASIKIGEVPRESSLFEERMRKALFLGDDFCVHSINEKDINKEYELFNKEELDKLLNDCINYIIDELKKVGVMNE